MPVEQQIYRSLREALMAGRVPAGEGISIRSIADQLNVSAAPVREALKRLEGDGALRARRKSAFYTAPVSAETFDDILKVRVQLEGLAAHDAALRATPNHLRVIEAAARRYAQALERDSTHIATANHAFHFSVYRACANSVLIGLIETLWVQMGPVLAHVSPAFDLHVALDLHSDVVTAIKRRDAPAAQRAVQEDLLAAAATIRRALVELMAQEGRED